LQPAARGCGESRSRGGAGPPSPPARPASSTRPRPRARI